MSSPFLYHAGDRLSGAELAAARLDGDVIEIGEAFMPADAVETRELRAGSLGSLVGPQLALTHESAAWVYGAIDDLPSRHCIQRRTESRIHAVLDASVRYRDVRLPPVDTEIIGGIAVSTPTRTIVDLLRDRVLREQASPDVVDLMLRWRPALASAAIEWLLRAGPVQHKRAALAFLRLRLSPHSTSEAAAATRR
jgi:hypothetical protein